jgi:Flp pilus assembly protein TadG
MFRLASRSRAQHRRSLDQGGVKRASAGRPMRRKTRGQALVEFAIILPILLTLFGAAVDIARVYQAWNVLESATRNAAEYAATNDTTSAAALSDAGRIVCAETGNPVGCSSPTVAISSFTRSTTAAGASPTYPIATVTVSTTLAFRTFFAYPVFTQGGAWMLSSSQTYSIVQGR